MPAGSCKIDISVPSDDGNVHAAIQTYAHPGYVNIDGGTLTCFLEMTKGTKKSSSFNIMPQYGDDFVTQQGCDALCQAIEGEAAAAVKDIIAWTRSTEKKLAGRKSFIRHQGGRDGGTRREHASNRSQACVGIRADSHQR